MSSSNSNLCVLNTPRAIEITILIYPLEEMLQKLVL